MSKEKKVLNKLLVNEHWLVRAAVANQGYGLDQLINDKDWGVRKAVASQGYGLDQLINDKDADVRKVALRKLEEIEKKK